MVASYPRTLANLRAAIPVLPRVWIFDSEDLRTPFRKIAVFEAGRLTWSARQGPRWWNRLRVPRASR